MATADTPESKRRSPTSTRIAAAALTLVAAGSGAAVGLRSGGDLAYAIGGSIGSSLPWFLVLWLGVFRGQSKRPFVTALFVVAVALFAGIIASLVAKERDQEFARSVNAAFRDYTGGKQIDPRAQTSGDQGKVEALLRALLSQQAADDQAYRAQVDQLHVEDAFGGAALAADPTATRAYEVAARGEQLISAYRQRYEARIDGFKARLAASDISPYVREDMERSFNAGVASGRPLVEEGFELQARYVGELSAAAKVLQAATGGWRIAGGAIQFDDPTSQAGYLAHVQAAQRLASEIDAYTARARASNAANVDRLGKP